MLTKQKENQDSMNAFLVSWDFSFRFGFWGYLITIIHEPRPFLRTLPLAQEAMLMPED